jgi:DNA-binding beta-propeller fold protein YncE
MKIFISYSSRDTVAVQGLADDLEKARQQVWLDQDLGGGEAWWTAILSEIQNCTVFVLALSDHALTSKPCRAEIEYAKSLGIPILPVQIGEVASYRTDPIFAMQFIDYRDSTKNSGIELISALHERAAHRGALPDPLPEPPPVPFEYLQRLGAAIRSSAELAPSAQAAMVFELRTALDDENDDTVRSDIRNLLRELGNRPDVTRTIARDIDGAIGEQPVTSAPPASVIPEAPAVIAEKLPPIAAPATGRQARSRRTPMFIAATVLLVVAVVVVSIVLTRHPTTEQAAGAQQATAQSPRRQTVVKVPPPAGHVLSQASLAADSAGTIYIVEFGGKNLWKLPPGAGTPVALPFTGSAHLMGVAVDPQGTVYATDNVLNKVFALAPGASGPVELPFDGSRVGYIAADTEGNVYVTDLGTRVLKLAKGASTPVELPVRGLQRALGVAVGSDGSVYITDPGSHRVVKLSGSPPTQTELPFSGLGSPFGVAVDKDSNVYISDNGFDGGSAAALELQAGNQTAVELPFDDNATRMDGIAVDGAGNVYVAGKNEGELLKLAPGPTD